MKTGRRTVLSGILGMMVAGAMPARPAKSQGTGVYFDFGLSTPAAATGYQRVLKTDAFTTARGWGWTSTTGLDSRDRGGPAPLERDFVFLSTTAARSFRIANLTAGRRYRLTVLTGDLTFGDHYTRVQVPGIDGGQTIPVVRPGVGQFATITATLVVPTGSTSIDVTFDATQTNWVVNAITLEQVTDAERVRISYDTIPATTTWGPILTAPDPTAALIAGHRTRTAGDTRGAFHPTSLTRADYLTLIASEIDFWKTKQNTTTGAIIDPLRNVEFQYSTPAFAHAAATLVVYAGRTDLLEAAALALDWSAQTLSARQAASGHEDFFAPMIAHSIRLLKPLVPASRSATWEYNIWYFEPYLVYRYAPGVNNWNMVAASGEALFQMMGIRDSKHTFPAVSFARQGTHFSTQYGLYLEGPMAYDHFPRLWVADLVARGYNGAYSAELGESLRRAAITSLFMQSPLGELPAGGRSAHHQWNEAQQCGTYEIYAARAFASGDSELAAYFKRAAHLSLKSMRRWVRPSGEMQIVKNWVDPSLSHAYETYSAQSQYNLLPMSMLAMAYEHAATTESITELPAPADTGGYVLQIQELDKVFANAGGAYVEIETAGDHDYDATGLIRVHFSGHSPQLGPSDSVLAAPAYVVPSGSPVPPTTGIGVSWFGTDNVWHQQGELLGTQIQNLTLDTGETTVNRVVFSLRYEGSLGGGVSAIEDQFILTPDVVQLTTTLPGFVGPVRRIVPILVKDGQTLNTIQVVGDQASVWQPGARASAKHTFQMKGASSVSVGAEQYPNHNGWASLAVGEYPVKTGKGKTPTPAVATLLIQAQGDRYFD